VENSGAVSVYADRFFAEVYDHIVPYRERQADVTFYVDLAREAGGAVLELGCGTGRVLIPTARAGVEIVGLDGAGPMLLLCRAKLEAEPEATRARASLVEGDMRGFDLGRTFALVTCPFRPFQHLLTVDEQLECLAAVRQHLAPGGRFAVDLFDPDLGHLTGELGRESAPEPAFDLPDGRSVVRRHRIVARDLSAQWQDVELIHDVRHPDGREERLVHAFRMRHSFRFEVEHLLARAGFVLEAGYSDFERNPLGTRGGRELIFVARRD
jgi:SAM-dependent methyltransferase